MKRIIIAALAAFVLVGPAWADKWFVPFPGDKVIIRPMPVATDDWWRDIDVTDESHNDVRLSFDNCNRHRCRLEQPNARFLTITSEKRIFVQALAYSHGVLDVYREAGDGSVDDPPMPPSSSAVEIPTGFKIGVERSRLEIRGEFNPVQDTRVEVEFWFRRARGRWQYLKRKTSGPGDGEVRYESPNIHAVDGDVARAKARAIVGGNVSGWTQWKELTFD